MYNPKAHQINGKFIYPAIISNGNQRLRHPVGIKRMNVFPVNGKETGKTICNYIILHGNNPAETKNAQDKMITLIGKIPISDFFISPVIGMQADNGAI